MHALKTLLAVGFAAGVLGAAANASAATIPVTVNMNAPSADGTISGTFTSNAITAPGPFDADISWTWPVGFASVNISSTFLNGNDINFTTVKFNGTDLHLITGGNGTDEFRNLNGVGVLAGVQHLIVNGTFTPSGDGIGQATFSGNLLFTPGAVPEPATWAMMILGMGMVGYGLRMRRKGLVTA